MPTIRATNKKNGQEVVINVDRIVYAEPAGDGSSTNLYLSSRDMLSVTESLDVIEERMNTFTTLDIIEAAEMTSGEAVATIRFEDVDGFEFDTVETAQALYDAAEKYLASERSRDTGNPLERETPAGSSKNKNKDKQPEPAPETKPAAAPETKAETEAGGS